MNRFCCSAAGKHVDITPTCVGMNRGIHRFASPCRQITPTCVEMNRYSQHHGLCIWHYPHMRGDEPATQDAAAALENNYPHMRGDEPLSDDVDVVGG